MSRNYLKFGVWNLFRAIRSIRLIRLIFLDRSFDFENIAQDDVKPARHFRLLALSVALAKEGRL